MVASVHRLQFVHSATSMIMFHFFMAGFSPALPLQADHPLETDDQVAGIQHQARLGGCWTPARGHLAHVPEKWIPVFRKSTCANGKQQSASRSAQSAYALAAHFAGTSAAGAFSLRLALG